MEIHYLTAHLFFFSLNTKWFFRIITGTIVRSSYTDYSLLKTTLLSIPTQSLSFQFPKSSPSTTFDTRSNHLPSRKQSEYLLGSHSNYKTQLAGPLSSVFSFRRGYAGASLPESCCHYTAVIFSIPPENLIWLISETPCGYAETVTVTVLRPTIGSRKTRPRYFLNLMRLTSGIHFEYKEFVMDIFQRPSVTTFFFEIFLQVRWESAALILPENHCRWCLESRYEYAVVTIADLGLVKRVFDSQK